LSAGVPNSPLSGYYQVKDSVIAHNTVVNTTGVMMTFDDGLGSSGRTLLPENVTVANNLFRSSGATVFEGNEGADWIWEGNLAFGGSLGPKAGDAGITVVDPQLEMDADGIWRLGDMSPARNAAIGNYSQLVMDDMDGQPRIGLYDIGADQYSDATIVRKPLQAGDVGPNWLDDIPGGGGSPGCNLAGCAIQAEDFTELLDPNNNGLTWTTIADNSALNGQALEAPNGSRTELPGVHDAIAVYEVSFEQPGTYRAYYRAKGFDGSSDSIYVPDGFNMDPDNSDSLSQDGAYRWEVGGLFSISAANVGVPLEFRIGRREGTARFDALVLNLDQSLSASELDDLFAVQFAAADFNHDGHVDSSDLATWQTYYGTASGALAGQGDANGDGSVDGRDFLIWQREFSAATPSSATSVPEPPVLALLVASIAALNFTRTYIPRAGVRKK
jgi:hypothetical protein